MEFIPYGKQYIDQDDINAVIDVLSSDWLTQGPKVHEFEEAVASYHNCKYAVAFSNGTAALHGAYYVSTKFPFGKGGKTIEDLNKFLRCKKSSQREYEDFKNQYWEFITSPITFAASVNGGLYCGGTPKFVDIDKDTYCIDIDKIEEAIIEDTRAITPVSYAGYPVDIRAIRELPKVKENNLCIIHDACHAIGAKRDGHGIADFADMTILSFHPVKHITTGEGGMVLTNNEEYYKKLVLFRSHGITKEKTRFRNVSDGDWYYEMQELGYNYRITDFQCALGIRQLKKIDRFIARRREIAEIYDKEFHDLDGLVIPARQDGCNSSYHLYVIQIHEIDRKIFYDKLKAAGIGVNIHYIPVYKHPYYQRNGYENVYCENTEKLYRTIVSLPIYPSLTEEEQIYVIDQVKKAIRDHKRYQNHFNVL